MCSIGGRTRARTLDPLIKSQLLYQLSYAPAATLTERRELGVVTKELCPCPAPQTHFASFSR
ncbi:hypothetical protein CHELA20_52035 [Hyphomicrobiales bacterium]|nr:hypothetical protein CHELA41_22889 [Hyphomicrobiales bacterium]CAH1680203.1 hypothetical protein CHELA20_52035 [Hyphomicrobiales bacterium]